MEVSYLKAVLRAGLGTAFSEDTQSRDKPCSSGVQLQQPIQNRGPFSTALWDNEDELEDVAEEVVFDEFFGNTSPRAKPGPMDDQESGAEQKVESDRYLLKPTTDTNEEIIGEDSFAQDNSLPMLKKADVDLHSTSELKMGRSDARKWEKEVKEDKSGAQNIASKIDIQQPAVKRVQSKESDRIPIKDPSLQIEKSPEQIQPQPSKTKIVEPQKEKIRIPSDIARQEKIHESEALVKTGEKEVKQDHVESQNIASKIDIQQPDAMRVKPKESDRIPTVEVAKQHAIQVPRSSQLSSPSSVSQLLGMNAESQEPNGNKQMQKSPEQLQPQPRKSIIAEPQKEQIRTPSDMAKQEKVHEPEALMKSVKVLRKPTGQQNLNAHFFTASLKKGETQTAKIAKDIALINKKLDEHISKEQPEPDRPVFLPKRPASRNLGGWSNLERNYIR